MGERFTIIGNFIDTPNLGTLRLREGVSVVVDQDTGSIASIGDQQEGPVIELEKGQFVVPGFIDIHCHAPQFPNCGLGSEVGLLEWLQKYTFPEESKYKDAEYAEKMYRQVVSSLIKQGTTCCVYFASIHKEATMRLCRLAEQLGQRAFVGKVCMEHNCPQDYRDQSIDAAISDNQEIVKACEELKLVQPIVTPRFAPVCSMEMMKALSELSNEHNLLIQSHISENEGEVEWMKELFPKKSYAQVYDSCGLLNDRTIMAHAIYLSDAEIALFRQRDAAIAHCPVSNYGINSGILDVRKIVDSGIKCGLGSDISGGWSGSLLEVMRYALVASRSLAFTKKPQPYSPLTVNDVFYLGTRGSAKCIQRANDLGMFEVGFLFDALIVQSQPGNLTDEFHKFFFTGDDRSIKGVFVGGKRVN